MNISAEDNCPCGSGRPIKNCCLREDGSLRPDRWRSPLSGERTGIKNSKCYASALSSCSQIDSGEHYISEGILKLLGDGETVEIEGLSWQDEGEVREYPTGALNANVLCKRHNEGLSGLDSAGIDFFRTLLDINRDFSSGTSNPTGKVYLFNGHDVERWMLKTLCGIVSSGNAESKKGKITNWTPPERWLSILYHDAPFPSGWGLYSIDRIGERRAADNRFSFAPLTNERWNVYGAVIRMNSRRFILSMKDPPSREAPLLKDGVYRPAEFVIENKEMMRVVVIGWSDKGDDKSVKSWYDK